MKDVFPGGGKVSGNKGPVKGVPPAGHRPRSRVNREFLFIHCRIPKFYQVKGLHPSPYQPITIPEFHDASKSAVTLIIIRQALI
jgi:hypothetical protein